jgi:hypothetical protein
MSTLTFDRAAHAYRLNGEPVRSVTQILRKVGLIRFDGVPTSILTAAMQRGTAVHAAVHFYNEQDLDLDGFAREFPGYFPYLASWMRLAETGRLQMVGCEVPLASFAPRYAGTLDWLGLFDGRPALIDFATGSPEDVCKELQTAGYAAARPWLERYGPPAVRAFLAAHPYVERYSVRLMKSGALPVPHRYPDPADLTAFRLIAATVNLTDALRPKLARWEWEADLRED